MKYKYIVFDFDGTLADSKAVFIALYNELAQQKGYKPMTAENLEYLRGLSISERCKELGVPMYKIPFLASALVKSYKNSVPLLKFNKGIREMLQSLTASGVPYAIVSTNSEKNIKEFLSLNGLEEVQDIFCSRSVFGKHVLLKKFLKSKNLKPSDILYVGDEARDIIACRKAGVDVAWVSWGYDTAKAIENHAPDYTVDSPSQLLALAGASISV